MNYSENCEHDFITVKNEEHSYFLRCRYCGVRTLDNYIDRKFLEENKEKITRHLFKD